MLTQKKVHLLFVALLLITEIIPGKVLGTIVPIDSDSNSDSSSSSSSSSDSSSSSSSSSSSDSSSSSSSSSSSDSSSSSSSSSSSESSSSSSSSSDSDFDKDDWRKNALIYHIDPKSFQDSDGDGYGDFQGIIDRLEYLDDLQIDAIKLSSIYPYAQTDSGRDVLNHTDIHFKYGNFSDFDELIEKAHQKDIKVILDIIPNHSDDNHDWFLASANNIKPYDDYYIWADGEVVDNKVVPPNNLKSAGSDKEGSAWTWNKQRKQWYYHKFDSNEPNLNLQNEDVVSEILDIFDFWLDNGVDGFCIGGISYFFENELLEYGDNDDDDNNDEDDKVVQRKNDGLLNKFHNHINEWVQENKNGPKLLIGEINEDDDAISSYYRNKTFKGITPLNFNFIKKINDSINALSMIDLIEDSLDNLPKHTKTNWMLSHKDYSRAASRLDPGLLDGLYMISLLLPGQAIIYFGEEIGMLDTNISWIDKTDVFKKQAKGTNFDHIYSRAKVRTPMQWDNTTSAGFSTMNDTFLPVNSNYININVEEQLDDVDSNLRAFKNLTTLRKKSIFTDGDYELKTTNDDNIFILKRSLDNDTCIVIINFGESNKTVNITALYPDLENLQIIIDLNDDDEDDDSDNNNKEEKNDEDDDTDLKYDSLELYDNEAIVLCENNDIKPSQIETVTNAIDDNDKNDKNDKNNSKEEVSDDLNSPSTVKASLESEPQNLANRNKAFLFIIIIQLTLMLLVQEL